MRVLRTCLSVVMLAASLPVAAGGEERSEPYACRARPDVVGRCTTVRGRLSFWNGTPSARIWPVGTKRLLGVRHDVLPPAFVAWMNAVAPRRDFDTEVWASFTVCPLTRYETGRMQLVCIEAWRAPSLGHRKQ